MLFMTGIILSGGESRRMGKDKAFLAIDGIPMIERVLGVFRRVFDRIIIVTNMPDAYRSYGVVMVGDALPDRGSLTGIYSGLLASGDDYNFIAACDMPYLNPGLLAYMLRSAEGYDIAAPAVGGFVEPLHAVYHRGVAPLIREQIGRSDLRIRSLFERVRTRFITAAEIDRFDPEHRSFINLNTPQEFKEAACLDSECRS